MVPRLTRRPVEVLSLHFDVEVARLALPGPPACFLLSGSHVACSKSKRGKRSIMGGKVYGGGCWYSADGWLIVVGQLKFWR